MKLAFIEEPDLEFGNGSRHIDPRSGITNSGPADVSNTSVRTIQVGIVGTKEAIEGVKAWLDRCREPIAPKNSPLSHLYLPFPGFHTGVGFRSTIIWNGRLERTLDKRALADIATTSPLQAVQKAVELYGLGNDAVRWIEVDSEQRMRMDRLRERMAEDRRAGFLPFLVIGTGGSVATGAVDPLPEIATLCREERVWFHVDGAYGAPAARVPGAPATLAALGDADSVAVDPHKWFYAPLEAGCALVRDPNALRAAFSHQPSYYHFPDVAEDPAINFHELGPQNSRGFRALKVWLAFKQVGREGYTKLIADDIALSRRMYEKVEAHPELEALTHGLSITTFRYVPRDLSPSLSPDERTKYLNELNTTLLTRLQEGGAIYLSNAVIDGVFALRACIVNFRTSVADVDAVPDIVVKAGRMLSQSSR